ncbi:NAD-dependent epimerase/dehydratase family protein [Lactobacillus sp. UCMA15818]|uniref:NAD-dependent epimerase/dehydratase family protein n=1 Tax=Lactobacillus sp. UCMA15818 TaxID=2583394 RepID=UPI0025AF10E5|nr:NAD-dependent epimerase/dehydratase family protein [Lactobacillus sp. UCMA15818]MDN2453663.1 NAD-dependent epimerase/dehydratase family protein [Lactobacillus sp. UCMA15818]
MKVVVFGASGFIGSHVVSSLFQAKHNVTAVVRPTSNASFLEEQGIHVVRVNYNDLSQISAAMKSQDIVYNCTASTKALSKNGGNAIEISLTKVLVDVALNEGVHHFVQLSSITIYGFEKEGIIDEDYQPLIKTPTQILQQEREKVVINAGKTKKMVTTIVRPASTIGERGEHSFFAKMFELNQTGEFPIVGRGAARTSFIDTRDIGQAMTLIGEKKLAGIYLVKGFDATWIQVKNTMDNIMGQKTNYKHIPETTDKQNMQSYEYKTFATTRVWNDLQIREQGFYPRYSLQQAAEKEIYYLKSIIENR